VQIGKDDMYTTLEMLPDDAKLIAAAPDLVAALRALVSGTGAWTDLIRNAQAALSKAGSQSTSGEKP
jgi:hypothetical protein